MNSMLSKVRTRYPRLFVLGSPEEFWCEDGWFGLIDRLCRDINALLENSHAPVFYLAQVKQKYGELRFYVRVQEGFENRDRILAPVAEAKAKSVTICELCGAPGRLEQWRPGDGFWQTLCDAHGAEEKQASKIRGS